VIMAGREKAIFQQMHRGSSSKRGRASRACRSGGQALLLACAGLAASSLASHAASVPTPSPGLLSRVGHGPDRSGSPRPGHSAPVSQPVEIRGGPSSSALRRQFLPLLGVGLAGCACAACAPQEARAEAMGAPDPAAALFLPMWMVEYEQAVSAKKAALFDRLLPTLPKEPTIYEIGMGSFPNALYLGSPKAPKGMKVVGIDAVDDMESFAQQNARLTGILDEDRGNSLTLVRGVAESLPVEDKVADAVLSTLSLCSVEDPEKAVSEMRRILKPGGRLLFWEHVLSETDPDLAQRQRRASNPTGRKDGCRLDRRTLETIRAGGFSKVDGDYFELQDFGFVNPTVSGFAVA